MRACHKIQGIVDGVSDSRETENNLYDFNKCVALLSESEKSFE